MGTIERTTEGAGQIIVPQGPGRVTERNQFGTGTGQSLGSEVNSSRRAASRNLSRQTNDSAAGLLTPDQRGRELKGFGRS